MHCLDFDCFLHMLHSMVCLCHRRLSRKKRFGGNNWLTKHEKYVAQWETRERVYPTNGPRSVPSEYREYLAWLHRSTRIRVHPPATSIPIDEIESDDEDRYDVWTRQGLQPERAPLQNYMVNISLFISIGTSSKDMNI